MKHKLKMRSSALQLVHLDSEYLRRILLHADITVSGVYQALIIDKLISMYRGDNSKLILVFTGVTGHCLTCVFH